MGASEIIGDLASDFIESKTKWFFDVSCHIVWSLVFIVDFADHSKNWTKVCIYYLLCIKEKGRREVVITTNKKPEHKYMVTPF